MTFYDFDQAIISLSEENFIAYLQKNVAEIRKLFFNTSTDEISIHVSREVFLTIQRRRFNESTKNNKLFQGVVNQFAILFKRVGDLGLLYHCRHLSRDKVFFARIEAYIFYREYSNISFYSEKLYEYLGKISEFLSTDGDNYSNDVIDDVLEYYTFAIDQLTGLGGKEFAASFREAFLIKTLIDEFPFLEEVYDRIEFVYQGLTVEDRRDQIFEPSDFSGDLFQKNVISPVQGHPATRWPSVLMGYDIESIRQDILEYGLADFDQPYKEISCTEKVKMYCFLNMRKHFFTSLYLFECLPDIVNLYNGIGRIKFIDIGCGPGTSGLALIDHINSKLARTVVLDYFGIDISHAMLNEAQTMFLNDIVDDRSQLYFSSNFDVVDEVSLAGGSCIIINACYLFASESLEIAPFVELVKKIRALASHTPLFMFYQNALSSSKNKKYIDFKTFISGINIVHSSTATINYFTQRNSIYPPKGETAVFEILKFNNETTPDV